MLDYLFVRAVQERQAEEIKQQRKESEKQYKHGKNKGGRVIRTTSDVDALDEDFFERVNADMRSGDGGS